MKAIFLLCMSGFFLAVVERFTFIESQFYIGFSIYCLHKASGCQDSLFKLYWQKFIIICVYTPYCSWKVSRFIGRKKSFVAVRCF